MMTDDIDWSRLARYLAGEASPGERAELEQWLAADPRRRGLLDDARRRWEAAGADRASFNVDAAWATLSRRMDGAPGVSVPSRTRRSIFVQPSFALAAVLVLLIGGAALWRRMSRTDDVNLASFVAGRIDRTRPGERRTIDLPDGTQVTLAVGSELRVARDYGSSSRQVALVGEAFFRVRHHPTSTFIVRVGKATAEDLGTEFVVRAYPGSDSVRVVVTSGRVALAAGGDQRAVLDSGQLGVIAGGGAPVVVREADLTPYLAWRDGRIVFRNAPLSAVATELGRWYDASFVVGDSAIAAKHLSVELSAADSLDEVLRVVALSVGVRYERRGREVAFVR
jgi:ferric-dicitrate binding protein FerR (iron transport regulator)